jgi:hypothetical protein
LARVVRRITQQRCRCATREFPRLGLKVLKCTHGECDESLHERPHPQGRVRRCVEAARPHFDDGRIRVYKHVPQEVFRRLCSAPNPGTYWEDRIAEEYPKGPDRSARGDGPTLKDLFGDPEEKP